MFIKIVSTMSGNVSFATCSFHFGWELGHIICARERELESVFEKHFKLSKFVMVKIERVKHKTMIESESG